MKLLISAIFILLGSNAFAANDPGKKLMIDQSKSKLNWVGEKKIGDKHDGLVGLKSGHITVAGNKVTGGELIVDMTTITNADLKDQTWNDKLVTHLKSEDFFHTEKHPTAKFTVTKVTPIKGTKHKVEGTLTIRNKTHPESFEADIVEQKGLMTAKGTLKFDRLKYGITFNSESPLFKTAVKLAKDRIIKDTVQLSFDLATVSN